MRLIPRMIFALVAGAYPLLVLAFAAIVHVRAARGGPPPPPPIRLFAWPALALGMASGAVALAAAGPTRRLLGLAEHARKDGEALVPPRVVRDEIDVLVVALADARARTRVAVEDAERRRAALTEHVQGVGHDLGVPLTVLQGHLAELERLGDEANGALDRPTLHRAMAEIHFVAAVLGDLAARAELEEGSTTQDTLPEVDLGAALERVVARHHPLARRARVALDHAVPPTPLRARANVVLAERAFSNLVHNAIRHNAEGGTVAVVLDRRPQGFVLRVSDDGPGVDAALVEAAVARGRRGLGIVRRVANHHGWQFRIDPHPQRGTVATLSSV